MYIVAGDYLRLLSFALMLVGAWRAIRSAELGRAVAEEFASGHANVDYFPSYEFVSVAAPDTTWAWDYRHVKPNLVGHIMTAFHSHYVR